MCRKDDEMLIFEITLDDERIKEIAPHIKEIRECKWGTDNNRIHGYHIIFKNDYLLSIQFGWVNYCDNYNLDWNNNMSDYRTSSTAEIAYWKLPNGNMQQFEENSDTVLGYQTFDDVVGWMKKISAL